MHNFSDLVQREQLHGNYFIHSSIYLNQYKLTFILYTVTKIRYKWPYLPELIDSCI